MQWTLSFIRVLSSSSFSSTFVELICGDLLLELSRHYWIVSPESGVVLKTCWENNSSCLACRHVNQYIHQYSTKSSKGI